MRQLEVYTFVSRDSLEIDFFCKYCIAYLAVQSHHPDFVTVSGSSIRLQYNATSSKVLLTFQTFLELQNDNFWLHFFQVPRIIRRQSCSLCAVSVSSNPKVQVIPTMGALAVTIKELWVYPVKSCQGVQVTSANVTATG
jgi:hypothetical protein